jgi:hypothetical protein
MRLLAGLVLLGYAAALPAVAQTQENAGLEADWDIRPVLQEISDHAGRLLPALAKFDAKDWVAKGASETYAAQLESARQQASAVLSGAKALAANPDRLAPSLELFFRIEGVENMLGSLAEAVAKYATPAEAQALSALSAQNGTNRERLRRYIVNLADEREKQFEVMDREAQRCRAFMSTQPAPRPATGRKK